MTLSNCEVDTVDPDNNVVSWKNVNSDWEFNGDVYFVEASLVSSCQNKYAYHNKMLILDKTAYDYFKLSCEQVNGRLPIVNNNRLITDMQSKTNELMRNLSTDADYRKCATENGMVKFWLGQYKDSNTGKWTNPYNENDDFVDFKVPQTPAK